MEPWTLDLAVLLALAWREYSTNLVAFWTHGTKQTDDMRDLIGWVWIMFNPRKN